MELGPVVREAVRMIRATLPATIAIVQKFEDRQSMVIANPTQIQQVVLNLCGNAAHAMRSSSPSGSLP